MSKKGLIIVESPSKAKTISKFLNNKYYIKSSVGHIRDLPKSTLGIDIENNFAIKYVQDKNKTKIIKELRETVKKVDTIFLASDHDREGEAIAWHLKEVLSKELKDKKVYRIIFNEITKKAIVDSLKYPGEIDLNKVNAQQARRALDRIVGYIISPLLWKVISKNLSAGRVQSVALRLVCEREKEIKKFIPEEYWRITAELFKDDYLPFKAKLVKFKNKKINIKNKNEANKIEESIEDKDFIIDSISETERKNNSGPAYITSTLQQDAARILYFSAGKTMVVAQQLYEGLEIDGTSVGLITYMRTDSVRLSDESIGVARNEIISLWGEKYLSKSKKVFKNKNKAQDAHEAIRPTNPALYPEKVEKFLEKDQFRLYSLIWKKFIATQMAPQIIIQKNIEIKVNEATFNTLGQTIKFKGFTACFAHSINNKDIVFDENYTEGMILEMKDLNKEQLFTKPPARYSEASLIKDLESKGIGRPSTYAAITNTIILRKYVENIERKFIPTKLGMAVNEFLSDNLDRFFNVSFTAEMENELDEVEFGNIEWKNILKDNYSTIKELINSLDLKSAKKKLIESTEYNCEKCNSKMVLKWSKNGQILACSNFPECSNIKDFAYDENGKIKILQSQKVDHQCPECNSDLYVKSGRFGKFIACSNFPKCKYTEKYVIDVECPECDNGKLVEMKNKKGKIFYGCSNYPDCNFISNDLPVFKECKNCDSKYLIEKKNKSNSYYVCPKCKEKQ